jgi:TetR/AcrR family transcriptional regulator, fatty acid metabolism regulator protein
MNINSLNEDIIRRDKSALPLDRKERDRRLRRADIMEAAERIFALKGYHKATIQDIAKAAQYATGTVYLYFEDKDELYFSLREEKIRDFLRIAREKIKPVEGAREKLETFVGISLLFFEKNRDFFLIFLSERSKVQAIKDAKLSRSAAMLHYREFVVELIKKGQEQRVVRGDFSPGQIADIFISIFMTAVFDWFKEGEKPSGSLTELSAFILDAFINGAGKRK